MYVLSPDMTFQVQEFYQKFNGLVPDFAVIEAKAAAADERFVCTLTMPQGSLPAKYASAGVPCFEEHCFKATARNKKGCVDAAAKLGLDFLRNQPCYQEMMNSIKVKAVSNTPATLLEAVVQALSVEVRLL